MGAGADFNEGWRNELIMRYLYGPKLYNFLTLDLHQFGQKWTKLTLFFCLVSERIGDELEC